jgi:hypothetical protein
MVISRPTRIAFAATGVFFGAGVSMAVLLDGGSPWPTPSAAAAMTPPAAATRKRGSAAAAEPGALQGDGLSLYLSIRSQALDGRPRGGDGLRLDRSGRALGHEALTLGWAAPGGGGERGAPQIARGLVALVGVLRERALDDRVEIAGEVRDEHARLRRRVGEVRPQPRLVALALERHLARERVEEQAPKRVDVGARIDALAADLLGRDVVQRADPVSGLGGARDRQRVLGEPKVRQVDVVLGGQQDVGGLDVAVDEAGAVRRVERRPDLADDPRRTLGRKPALAAHQAADVVAGDVAHRDVRDAVLLARVIDRDDVGVVDRRGDLRLAHEALPDRLVLEQPGRDDLQGDGAVERELRGPVDDAHAATAGHRVDPVAREDAAGFQLTHRREVYRPVALQQHPPVRNE